MTIKFNIDIFVEYLNQHKDNLPNLYNRNAKIDKLIELDILTNEKAQKINKLTPYQKELKLKKIVGKKLGDTYKNNKDLFYKLCLWLIKDWGGISTSSDKETIKLIDEFLIQERPGFNRIASASKVGAYLLPKKNVIYDSRVAYSINWIILSRKAGNLYFPIPKGRNSKMSAFDLNVLIRLKNISDYNPADIKHLDDKRFIKKIDDKFFINKNNAYYELNKLIKEINQELWEDDPAKKDNLYFTEMLLFSIADREVFMDITKEYGTIVQNNNE